MIHEVWRVRKNTWADSPCHSILQNTTLDPIDTAWERNCSKHPLRRSGSDAFNCSMNGTRLPFCFRSRLRVFFLNGCLEVVCFSWCFLSIQPQKASNHGWFLHGGLSSRSESLSSSPSPVAQVPRALHRVRSSAATGVGAGLAGHLPPKRHWKFP